MIRTVLALVCCVSVVCATSSFSSQPTAESFVVKKKKSGKAGSKSKENVCREFGQVIKTGAQVVEKVAKVQGLGLEQTAQYLDGEDPFAGMTKAQMEELVHRSQELEQEMTALCQQCDEFAQYQKSLLTKKISS